MAASFKSFCGFCPEEIDRDSYERLVWGEEVELACGHSNTLASVFTPLSAEEKAARATPEVKRSTWFVLSLDPDLAKTIGADSLEGEALLPMRRVEGAWDAYWSGELARQDPEWRTKPLYLYELKVHRFMDFNPNVLQAATAPFDTKEYEGAKFTSRDYAPTSLGVVVKKAFVRLVKKHEVTVADAPEGSVYGKRVLDEAWAPDA